MRTRQRQLELCVVRDGSLVAETGASLDGSTYVETMRVMWWSRPPMAL